MKKLIQKVMAFILAFCATLSCTACGGGAGSNEASETLYIGIFNGGLGTEWLHEILEDFTKDTGIKTFVDPKKAEYRDDQLLVNMADSRQDVYILDGNSYYNMYNKGLIAEITDIATEKVYDEDGELASLTGKNAVASIVDKMDENFLEYCDIRRFADIESNAPVYYALANYATPTMFTYDGDLFDEKGYYFDGNNRLILSKGKYNDSKYQDKVVFVLEGGEEIVLGTGPDYKQGTLDDGLPITWNDTVTLFDAMVSDSIIPLTWAGSASGTYTYTSLLRSIIVNYEGADNMNILCRLSGEYNGNNKEIPTQITPANAYMLTKMNGKLAAITAMNKILSNELYFSENAKKSGQDNLLSEKEYAMSPIYGAGKRVAMYMEATYWECEAKDYFVAMEKNYPQYGWGKRNLKSMPVPNFIGVEGVPDQINTQPAFSLTGGDSLIVMNKNVETNGKEEMAKKFIQYLHTRKSLATHTAYNGTIRPYEYDINEEEQKIMTPYARNVWAYYESALEGNYDLFCSMRMSSHLEIYSVELDLNKFFWTAKKGAESAGYPYDALYTAGMSIEDYSNANFDWALATFKQIGLTK